MKKYLRVITAFGIFFLILEFCFSFFDNGKTVKYELDNDISINEHYIKSSKLKYYYVEVDISSKKFNFRVPSNFNDNSYIIKNIYTFSDDNYLCMLPIFEDDSIQTDILCQNGDKYIYQYRNLKNISLKLDNFASSMEQYGYIANNNKDVVVSDFGINLYKDNIISNHTLIIPSYKGLFKINNGTISSIDLFNKDIYRQDIQAVVSDYYLVADYDSNYSFNKFKLVNLKNGKITTFKSKYSLSMNSYVQGVLKDSIYVMDCSNRKQYEINVLDKSVTLVGNSKKGILYFNGIDFETKSIYSAINDNLLFSSYAFNETYSHIYLTDNIYYSYKQIDNVYDAYISYNENKELYTYAFSVSSIDRIQYVDDYVYYIIEDVLYCYHPKKGIIKVLDYSELFYNPNLKFWIYKN